jgi:hypothetical protein
MQDSIFLGQRHGYGGSTRNFHLPADHLSRHCHVLGKTGMGKTTLLQAFVFSLIEQGRGVGVIDPHGDFVDSILDAIPRERIDDVVVLDLTDPKFAPALNLVASTVPPALRPRVASSLLAAFRHIWADSWGPRLEYILYHSLRVLLDSDNTSLIALPRLLTDQRFRDRLVKQCRDSFIRRFWENEFDLWDHRYRQEAIAPVLNKLGQFVSHPPLRDVFGQVCLKTNFRDILDSSRILIVNLSKGHLGDDASRLTGALIVAFLASQAMERSEMPPGERNDFTLVIDEAQNFLSDALGSILSESRKYGLGLMLSHQFLDQLSPPLQSAVLGNAGTLITFRVAADDAVRMASNFGDNFQPRQFVELEPFTAFFRALDEAAYPFRLSIAPPVEIQHRYRNSIVARCRDRYATSRIEVQKKLARWMTDSSTDLS